MSVVAAGDGVARRPTLASADLGRRALARCVDFGVGIAVLVATIFLFAALVPEPKHGTAIMLLAVASSMALWLLYEVSLVGVWGRTLGKRAVGVVVVGGDGGCPGLGRGFVRAVFPMVLLVTIPVLYPLPFLSAVFAPDGRGLHDHLAGTYVVRRSRSPV